MMVSPDLKFLILPNSKTLPRALSGIPSKRLTSFKKSVVRPSFRAMLPPDNPTCLGLFDSILRDQQRFLTVLVWLGRHPGLFRFPILLHLPNQVIGSGQRKQEGGPSDPEEEIGNFMTEHFRRLSRLPVR